MPPTAASGVMTTPRRAPWWLAASAVLFAAYYAIVLASDLQRPESPGFAFELTPTGLAVRDVMPGSPSSEAGLASGDRITAIDGRAIRSRLDWLAVEINLRSGDALRLDTVRDGAPRLVTLTLDRIDLRHWTRPSGASLMAARGVQLVTLALAILVACRRPFDRTARIAAWMLASLAVYSIDLPYGWAAHWRMLPGPVAFPLWMPFACSVAAPAVLFTFAATFPQVLIRRPLAWLAVWLPMIALVLAEVRFAAGAVYELDRTRQLFDWTNAKAALTVAYAAAGMAALAWGYRRSPDPTARRRVRVAIAGMLVGVATTVPVAVVHWTTPFVGAGHSMFSSPLLAAGTVVGLVFPLTFAYAILTRRLFDVGTIVRLGLQYALARRVLISLVPGAFVLFLADLWINRQVPLSDVLEARGWHYLALTVFAVVARARRQAWLDALDRRFFREHYNAQRILREVADQARAAGSLEEAAPYVIARINATVHPAFAALVRVRPEGHSCQVLAASTNVTLPLSVDSTIVRLLDVLRRPLPVPAGERSWLAQQLRPDELAGLRRAGVDLLIPVTAGADQTEVLLVLGPKRSEEPYSSEDQDLLAAIAGSLGFVLGRGAKDGSQLLRECPACGACYDAPAETCSRDGTALATRSTPRVLGGRFRLDRRVGSGGMGTVYEAYDTALGRRVATKLLRDDLTDSDAAERFRTEARLAASLVHPHVVTVHDVGVTASGRGFLVMELLEGDTLREEIRRCGRLRPRRAIEILRGVSAAVDAAHQRQMIHRDLKPENVFLCRGDSVDIPKVLDFGLAKVLADPRTGLTRSGLVAGTMPYMSPEHLHGDEPSVDWDLWALSVMAFEMMTGTLPFAGAPGESPRLDELAPSLRPLFARALAINPLGRPSSGRELTDELERVVACDELAS